MIISESSVSENNGRERELGIKDRKDAADKRAQQTRTHTHPVVIVHSLVLRDDLSYSTPTLISCVAIADRRLMHKCKSLRR